MSVTIIDNTLSPLRTTLTWTIRLHSHLLCMVITTQFSLPVSFNLFPGVTDEINFYQQYLYIVKQAGDKNINNQRKLLIRRYLFMLVARP